MAQLFLLICSEIKIKLARDSQIEILFILEHTAQKDQLSLSLLLMVIVSREEDHLMALIALQLVEVKSTTLNCAIKCVSAAGFWLVTLLDPLSRRV
jgi:hypothetical protein